MGDVGALSLGAALGTMAVIVRQEIVLFIMGGVFVVETLSVMIQVASFKLTGRRVFRMAPIHHHYELKGWKENQVVVRFWIITMLLVLFGLSTLEAALMDGLHGTQRSRAGPRAHRVLARASSRRARRRGARRRHAAAPPFADRLAGCATRNPRNDGSVRRRHRCRRRPDRDQPGCSEGPTVHRGGGCARRRARRRRRALRPRAAAAPEGPRDHRVERQDDGDRADRRARARPRGSRSSSPATSATPVLDALPADGRVARRLRARALELPARDDRVARARRRRRCSTSPKTTSTATRPSTTTRRRRRGSSRAAASRC